MKVSEVSAQLTPFRGLVDKHALSDNYKAIVLTPTSARAMASFGMMETEINLGIDSEVAVNGDAFLQVLRSLTSSEDLELATDDGVLRWRSGHAKGQFAGMGNKISVPSPTWPCDLDLKEVGSDFVRGLDLGSLACGTTALMSVGLYGIHVVNGSDGMTAYASDNVTMSRARVGEEVPAAAEFLTLSPDGMKLIAMLAQRGRMAISFDDATIYCQTPDTRLVVKQLPPLKMDIRAVTDAFLKDEVKINLNRDIISAFIRRSEALSEERTKAGVTISVEDGSVKLAFIEGRASSEEYYLAEGGPQVTVEPVEVDAHRLAKALTSAKYVVFDYVSRKALVLRGESGFAYVISAKARQS